MYSLIHYHIITSSSLLMFALIDIDHICEDRHINVSLNVRWVQEIANQGQIHVIHGNENWHEHNEVVSLFSSLELDKNSQSTSTAHNWQKWKRVFLTCPCHEIYRDEAVGLKSCKYTWKIMIYVNVWNLGQFREKLRTASLKFESKKSFAHVWHI